MRIYFIFQSLGSNYRAREKRVPPAENRRQDLTSKSVDYLLFGEGRRHKAGHSTSSSSPQSGDNLDIDVDDELLRLSSKGIGRQKRYNPSDSPLAHTDLKQNRTIESPHRNSSRVRTKSNTNTKDSPLNRQQQSLRRDSSPVFRRAVNSTPREIRSGQFQSVDSKKISQSPGASRDVNPFQARLLKAQQAFLALKESQSTIT